jgi:GntR family transcriptional regulator / MocR family aminotransferase
LNKSVSGARAGMSIAVESFLLDPRAGGSLQHRIRQMVAQGIISGRLRPAERMPSSRKLAAHLGVSRITVTLAYAELVADDFLTAKGRSGYFISASVPRPATVSRAPDSSSVDWARMLGHRPPSGDLNRGKPRNWRDYRFPFIYGQTDPTLFDHANWRLCMMESLGMKDFARMSDDQFEQDDPVLLEYIARHSLPRRGILARPEEILVTLGAQNALWLAAQLLLNQRRCAGIEEPGYPGLRAILTQTRCHLLPIPVGPSGLRPADLPQGLDVLFCTPSHHCPTGATMPIADRQALIAAAEADDFLIVEDDYEFEIAQGRAPLPALKSLDPSGRVIHIGSFSKSLFPGLRLGFMVGPERFIAEARALRATVLRHPPGLLQRAAARFLSLGHYDAMLQRLTRSFAARREVMLAAIRAEGLIIAGAQEDGGSSFWMRSPDGILASTLAEALKAESVLIETGLPFFGQPDAPDCFYRIAYSSIPAERIPEGIAKIARTLRGLG